MSMVGIIGLLLAIAILIFGAYKGLGALPLTMIAALVAIVFNGIPLWEGFATHYMAGYTSAYMSYFLMFACSALYAKLMDESGCATAIGYKFIDWFGRKNIMLVTILIVSVLTYGGVSLFVVVYAVAPIMFLLFKEANLPRHLTMACLIVGSATYTMTTLPGTPQLTNVVPTEYLGTTMTAAPVLSIICTVAIFAIGNTTAIIVGREIGAGRREHVYEVGATLDTLAFLCGLIIGIPLILGAWFVFPWLVYPFFHLSETAGSITTMMLTFIGVFLALRAFDSVNTVGVLRGGGDVRAATIIDTTPLWFVSLPLAALFGLVFQWGIFWVYVGIMAEQFAKFGIGLYRLRSREWINDVTQFSTQEKEAAP